MQCSLCTQTILTGADQFTINSRLAAVVLYNCTVIVIMRLPGFLAPTDSVQKNIANEFPVINGSGEVIVIVWVEFC